MSSVNIMHEWFKYLWEQRCNAQGFVYCFECGKALSTAHYKENSCCYSHILAKSTYPAHKGNPINIEIVCPPCHDIYTLTPKKAVKQYAKAEELKLTLNK